MATEKYVSLNNLSNFLDNIKNTFATKTEMDAKSDKSHIHNILDVSGLQSSLNEKASSADLDIIESIALLNKAATEANTSALKTMQNDIETLALKIRANEESLTNFIAISSQEINDLF